MAGEANRVMWRGVRPISGIRGVWPDVDAERIDKVTSQDGLGVTVFYTVPVGKKLFVTTAFISSTMSSGVNAHTNFFVRNAAQVTQFYFYQLKYILAGQQASGMIFSPGLEALEDWEVCLYASHASMKVTGIFHGWLEDA